MKTKNEKIVLKTLVDASHEYDYGDSAAFMYIGPSGDKQINEVIDTVYLEKGCLVPYHYNARGAETLLIQNGLIEVTLYGKTCECEAGDIINIPSDCPYSLKTLEEGCQVRGVYTGVDEWSRHKDLELIDSGAFIESDLADHIEKEFWPAHHRHTLTKPACTEPVEKSALPQITANCSSIYRYDGWAGISCELKVGRWNLKRVKEIWQFTIEKGYQLQYHKPNQNERLYCVKSGKIKVKADGEVHTAEANDIIHIPPYTPFDLTAVGEKNEIYDLNVSSRLFRMLEILELAQRDEPEKTEDPEWLEWLLGLNNCYLTGFVKL